MSESGQDELQLATPLRRLAALAIDSLIEIALWLFPISIFVLGVFSNGALLGLFIILSIAVFAGIVAWWIICLGHGQTPGKQLLYLFTMREDGSRSGGWYTFLREWIIKWFFFFVILSTFSAGLAPIIAGAWLLWDRERQTLWDKIVSTYIVYIPDGKRP
ncbi:MAG: RDD family protein [Chloroflexota bacterium]|nr:RDD family protein [Chloroflexota bacterium]